MKKIIKSLGVIAAMSVIVVGATRAYFSDTETSAGNIISAGTIDISVDGENPWDKTYNESLADMKPSQVKEIIFKVKNVSSNPVRVWKHLGNFAVATGTQSQPECDTEVGTWNETSKTCTFMTKENNKIDEVITYGMQVSYDSGTNWVVIIDENDHIKLDDIESAWIDLAGSLTNKALQPEAEILVKQSYHMQAEAGNEYQGDTLTFNIDILAQQLNAPEVTSGTLLMENKDANYNILKADKTWGFLVFNASGPTFDYTFKGHGLTASTGYSLIYYADPWAGNNPGALIGTMVTDANGQISTSGSAELNMDLPALTDANYPTGAKIWLVPSTTCYNSSTKSVICWPFASDILFEYNLIQYDDTDV